MALNDSTTNSGKRILVVDDNEMSRRLLEFPLSKDGHYIRHAESGQRGYLTEDGNHSAREMSQSCENLVEISDHSAVDPSCLANLNRAE